MQHPVWFYDRKTQTRSHCYRCKNKMPNNGWFCSSNCLDEYFNDRPLGIGEGGLATKHNYNFTRDELAKYEQLLFSDTPRKITFRTGIPLRLVKSHRRSPIQRTRLHVWEIIAPSIGSKPIPCDYNLDDNLMIKLNPKQVDQFAELLEIFTDAQLSSLTEINSQFFQEKRKYMNRRKRNYYPYGHQTRVYIWDKIQKVIDLNPDPRKTYIHNKIHHKRAQIKQLEIDIALLEDSLDDIDNRRDISIEDHLQTVDVEDKKKLAAFFSE